MFKRILATCSILLMAGMASAAIVTVDDSGGSMFTTIEEAITYAAENDVIEIADGVYNPIGSLSINKALTITGASENENLVIINIPAAGGYGISVGASNVKLEYFTLATNAANENFPIHASGTSNPPYGFDNLTIQYVKISGAHRRTGLDVHGYNHVVLSHLTSSNALGGNGLQITGCVDVDMDNITTMDNAWGSIAIYSSSSAYLNRGSSDIFIDGDTCSLAEKNLFNQNEFGLFNTDIVVDGYDFIVRNMNYREGADGYFHYQIDQADAVAFALGLDSVAVGSFIITVATGDLLVVDGMFIQPAIEAADPGDVLNVGAGLYEEQLHITTSDLTIIGAGKGSNPLVDTIIQSPMNLTWFYTTSANNYPIVGLDGVTGVTLQDMRIDGAGRGNLNYRFQGVGFWNSGGNLENVDVVNVQDTPFSGAQHGVGVYAYNETGGPYEVNLTSVNVVGYMKGGIALNGTGLTSNLVGCVTTGRGPTADTAQNGIQFYGGAGGSIVDCVVSDNIYTGTGWAAAGILLISAGTVTITDTEVDDGDPCVYCQDTQAVASGLRINNNHADSGNGFYVRVDTGITAKSTALAIQSDPAPFGDFSPNPAKADFGTVTVTLDNSTLIGQMTGYGVSASNYIDTNLIDLTVTNCTIKNWGWGGVLFGSGGEIASDFSNNGFIGNDGFFYAADALLTGQDASGNYWGTTDAAELASGVIQGNVDYTPWLGGGTEGAPGFSGDFSSLWVDDDSYQTGVNGRIHEGIGMVSGSTVNVATGTYVATSQIVIDRNLVINGAGSAGLAPTIIEAGFNTSTSSYIQDSALIYVAHGVTASINGMAIDGSGFTVTDGIQSRGEHLTVQDCAVRNISSSAYIGKGIVFLTGTGLVKDCVMSNIQRIGVHIRGNVEFPAPDVEVDGLTYTGKDIGDYLDYGVEFGGGGKGSVTGSNISACRGEATSDGSTSSGILVTDYYGTGTTAEITNTTLTGNTTGLVVGYAEADMSTVTIHNSNISGNTSFGVTSTGVVVDASDNWWGSVLGPYHPLANPLGEGNEVSDNILFDPVMGPANGDIVPVTTGPLNCSEIITLTFNYEADEYTPDMFLYNAVVSATAGLEFGTIMDLYPFGTVNNNFFAMQTGPTQWTITGSTVGSPTYPVSGEGTTGLFTIVFSATGDVDGAVVFDSLTLRDPDNITIPVNLSGATITYDCTAPAAVTGIAAAPGHNKIGVSWAHDGTDVDHYEVFSGLWHDEAYASVYPEYNDVANFIPTRGNYAAILDNDEEWVDLGDFAALATEQTWDPAVRGVYYYEVFAVDVAGNASPAAATNDRATNYWLGDVNGDGIVDAVGDINTLGAAFGTIGGSEYYNAYCDVGPTDDWSRLGVPTTDNMINFEDLMVFALNFGVVTAAKDKAPAGTSVDLAWVRYDDGSMALRLVDGQGLKGINLRANLPVNSVRAGLLLDEQQEMTFLQNIGNKLDVSVAVMGINNGFRGTGDLLVVEADVAIDLKDLVVTARSTDNSEMKVSLSLTSDVMTPRVFSLNPNYPNPFNPATKISFSLPERQPVKLTVYSIDGRTVAMLVNETKDPGLHEIIWSGRDNSGRQVPSGTYVFRIDAGPYSQSRKMMLLK